MRGNQTGRLCFRCRPYFNSRLYMRGNPDRLLPVRNGQNFNSRLYMRGNTAKTGILSRQPLFQFTPLHERQLQKYTIFSIKSTQFSTKPCFFIVTSQKAVFFFNSSSIFLINCIFLPAPMSHKKMYESHQRTHF